MCTGIKTFIARCEALHTTACYVFVGLQAAVREAWPGGRCTWSLTKGHEEVYTTVKVREASMRSQQAWVLRCDAALLTASRCTAAFTPSETST